MIQPQPESLLLSEQELDRFRLSTDQIRVRLGALFAERIYYENIPPYQRGFTWRKETCQLLIDTILRGGPVPPILANKYRSADGRTRLAIIDGQQRMGAICGFRDGKYATITAAGMRSFDPTPLPVLEPGKRYSQLPAIMRSAFDDYNLSFVILDGASDEVLSVLFRRLQNQQILSPGEILWSYDGAAANLARHLDHLSVWHAIYAGKTTRREAFQMSLYALCLQVYQMQDGPYTTLKLPTLTELASSFGNAKVTPHVKDVVQRNLRAVEWLFAGTQITAKSEFVALYQAVMQLERAGFDALASKEGCLSTWYGGVRNYHQHILFGGKPHILSQMVNLVSQRHFWLGRGDEQGHLESLLQQPGLVKHSFPIQVLHPSHSCIQVI